MSSFRISVGLALALLGIASGSHAGAPPECRPCGSWQLDVAASDPPERVVSTAFAQYKPPRPPRIRVPYGDIDAESKAEFEQSLDRMTGPEDPRQLRPDVLRLATPPATLALRADGRDVIVESDGAVRRYSPGEPHSRVDSLGTARIEAVWRSGALQLTEDYRRKTSNRETYAIDKATGRLKVTRTLTRPGLPAVVVNAIYQSR